MSEMTIGDLSRETGTPVETIRYYERVGLLPRPGRRSNKWRVYTPNDVAVLRFIRRARALEFNVADVRNLLSLREGRTCTPVAALTNSHLSFIRTRIETLQIIEKRLALAVGGCADGAPECSVLLALEAEPNRS